MIVQRAPAPGFSGGYGPVGNNINNGISNNNINNNNINNNNMHLNNDEDINCYNCCASKENCNIAFHDVSFIKRWFNSHLSLMALFCFTSFYISSQVPGAGAWLFLASLLSLIGGSIPMCCCPSNLGWKTCILFQALSIVMNLVLFLSGCVSLGSNRYDFREKRVLAILIACDIISVVSMSCIIQMARNSIIVQTVVPEVNMVPIQGQFVQVNGQPMMMQPGYPGQYVSAQAQYFNNADPNGNVNNGGGWVPAQSSTDNQQFYGAPQYGGGNGYNMLGGSVSGVGYSKSHWVDQPVTVVATPIGMISPNGQYNSYGNNSNSNSNTNGQTGNNSNSYNSNGNSYNSQNMDLRGLNNGGLLRAADEVNIQYNSRANNSGNSNNNSNGVY